MLAGQLYRAEAPDLAEGFARARRLMNAFNTAWATDHRAAEEALIELLGSIGDAVVVRGPLYVDYGRNISIGAGTFVNYGLTALDVNTITIGANCQIATSVQLLTAGHPIDTDLRRAGWEYGLPITIGDNVWLGSGAIVLPGVSIGDNSVIGAGSVVSRDIPANVVAVGNPVRVIRTL